MSKYELVNDQFKDRWINKPNNKGDVGDLQDITDELNRLLSELDEAREQNAKLRDIAERAMLFCDMRMRDSLRAELDRLKEGAK